MGVSLSLVQLARCFPSRRTIQQAGCLFWIEDHVRVDPVCSQGIVVTNDVGSHTGGVKWPIEMER